MPQGLLDLPDELIRTIGSDILDAGWSVESSSWTVDGQNDLQQWLQVCSRIYGLCRHLFTSSWPLNPFLDESHPEGVYPPTKAMLNYSRVIDECLCMTCCLCSPSGRATPSGENCSHLTRFDEQLAYGIRNMVSLQAVRLCFNPSHRAQARPLTCTIDSLCSSHHTRNRVSYLHFEGLRSAGALQTVVRIIEASEFVKALNISSCTALPYVAEFWEALAGKRYWQDIRLSLSHWEPPRGADELSLSMKRHSWRYLRQLRLTDAVEGMNTHLCRLFTSVLTAGFPCLQMAEVPVALWVVLAFSGRADQSGTLVFPRLEHLMLACDPDGFSRIPQTEEVGFVSPSLNRLDLTGPFGAGAGVRLLQVGQRAPNLSTIALCAADLEYDFYAGDLSTLAASRGIELRHC